MNLENYFKKHPKIVKLHFSRLLGVQNSDLAYWSYPPNHSKFRFVPAHVAVKIERLTQGEVLRSDLVDNWQAIWPEFDPAHSPYAPLAKDASIGQQIERASSLTGLSVLTTSLATAYGGWHTQYMAKPIAMKYASGALRLSPQQYAHGAVN
jgi:DNA-binding transcriptional regulator YdaS (Cro superfamily)